jgi:hypothetical protein
LWDEDLTRVRTLTSFQVHVIARTQRAAV